MLIQRMPAVIWQVVKMKMGVVPTFKFDPGEFKKVVRVCPRSVITTMDENPEVEFQYDAPFDGILGEYDPVQKKIKIDVLEIFVLSTEDPYVNSIEDFVRTYDFNLTRVLAHEGGHWHLDKRLGKLARAERYAIQTLVYLVACTVTLFVGLLILALINLIASGFLIYLSKEVVEFIELALVAVALWNLIDVVRKVFDTADAVTLILTHQLCYHEGFAKDFEMCVISDDRWEKVIEIELE